MGEIGEAGETGSFSINIESLAKGMYYLRVGDKTVKVIKN